MNKNIAKALESVGVKVYKDENKSEQRDTKDILSDVSKEWRKAMGIVDKM